MNIFEKSKRIKAVALSTVAALVIAVLVQTTYVTADDGSDLSDIMNGSGSDPISFFGSNKSSGSVEKEETVYIITKADGTKETVIVSDHLNNKDSKKKIKDKSDLKQIENIKGKEKFSRQTEDILEWAADGNDIFYQGTSNRSLPVTLDIRYYLNDEEVTGKSIQGKDGDVKIVVQYKNHTKTDVTVDGKAYRVCVPFVAMTGMILEDSSFSDVEVSNGRVIDDGERQIVVGTALPGVSESLGLSGSAQLPDKIEVTAHAHNFSLDYMMSVVTDNVFSSIDTSALDTGALDSGVSRLESASSQLTSGADSLVNGLNKAYGSSGKLPDALSRLAKGANQLEKGAETSYKGTGKLADGADTLAGNVSKLSDGLSSLSSGTIDLSSGAQKLYEAIRDELKPSASELADGAEALDSGIDQTAEAVGLISDADGNVLEYIEKALEDPLLDEQTKQNLEIAREYLKGSLSGQEKLKSQLTDSEDQGTIKYGSSALSDGLSQLDMGIGTAGNEGSLADGAKKISDAAAKLKSYVGASAEGSSKLSEGANKLASSTKELKKGQKKIKEAASQIPGGAETISAKALLLVNGLSKLTEGSKKLSSGMEKLYQQGIKRLADIYNNDVKGAAGKIRAMIFAAKGYDTFTKITRGMSGSVKFIYKTDPSEGTAKDKD